MGSSLLFLRVGFGVDVEGVWNSSCLMRGGGSDAAVKWDGTSRFDVLVFAETSNTFSSASKLLVSSCSVVVGFRSGESCGCSVSDSIRTSGGVCATWVRRRSVVS